jgi:hypothetical protein
MMKVYQLHKEHKQNKRIWVGVLQQQLGAELSIAEPSITCG